MSDTVIQVENLPNYHLGVVGTGTLSHDLNRAESGVQPPETGMDLSQVRIIPLRQEQMKERLGDRFRELDTPLLVEWPDGRRGALLFVVEEETQSSRFSIHRLVRYCKESGKAAEIFGLHRLLCGFE